MFDLGVELNANPYGKIHFSVYALGIWVVVFPLV
jgi:hypothetical protein